MLSGPKAAIHEIRSDHALVSLVASIFIAWAMDGSVESYIVCLVGILKSESETELNDVVAEAFLDFFLIGPS